MERKDAILHQINAVRKNKHRNIHDCATLLNISKEDYLKFEQGVKMLSLPEIELLALYFGVSPLFFFHPDNTGKQKLKILDKHVQPKFTRLRHKMLQAKIFGEIHKKSVKVDQIHEETEIPIAELNAYLNGKKPVPLDHLLAISEVLHFKAENLMEHSWLEEDNKNGKASTDEWQREFSAKEGQNKAREDSPYNQLIIALQKLPKKEQAEVAKIQLKKLKSIISE